MVFAQEDRSYMVRPRKSRFVNILMEKIHAITEGGKLSWRQAKHFCRNVKRVHPDVRVTDQNRAREIPCANTQLKIAQFSQIIVVRECVSDCLVDRPIARNFNLHTMVINVRLACRVFEM